MDFSPALVEHVFEPGSGTVDQALQIPLVNDAVYENDEVFIVRLNVSVADPVDEARLEIGIQYLELRILSDFTDGNVNPC